MSERDIGKKQISQKIDGDPKISYFEFLMILGRIALDRTPKEQLKKADKNYKFGENITPKYDLDFIIRQIDNELQPIPPQYMPQGLDGKNAKVPPKVIGEQPPKPPVDKNAKKPQDKKGQEKKKKKGEEEEREIIWAGKPQPLPKKTYDYFQELNDNLEFKNALEISKRSGTMSHIEPLPIILEEMIYPIQTPAEPQKYLEAAILNQAQSNFECALEDINACYDMWLNIEQRNELIIANEIFFDYFKGSLFLSAGREDLALSSFYSSKYPADKLSLDSPDKALPYCGLGTAFYRMEEYTLALRCFLKARELREYAIGGDNMETATVYNNIGCSMMRLNRNLEAATYFELSYAIFDLEIGQFHIRTSTVARNYQKCKKQGISYLPEFKTMWITYEQDPLKKKKSNKKGKTKK
ncbi:hypothetical protein IMG5_055690 [Ichthyophthirius multifiliis]|uniref:Tetratricopeptide repeat protein n=1 Tax=Ichthyophthirius multifiliis TaxID=5932 RepID=G0QN61_ICHMU|nr:hypothetical protein IMG5_055690 [Ichthyophthirius multifiliis]EGR33345.1 hypothetical protein IMG5_055690 [Ichthyophthirius multifiliis]|eukprot:XP_004037331.1 hypothetical protein IMG5_055690 [Ichthyophthirius multifiliis]